MRKTRFKKILLIQPMHEKQKKAVRTSINFPWGLASLATCYRKAGFEVEILDGQALQLSKEEILAQIAPLDFDVAGISAFSTQYPAVKLIAEHIKKRRKVPVITGGGPGHLSGRDGLEDYQGRYLCHRRR